MTELTIHQPTVTRTAPRRRVGNAALWALQVVTAAVFVFAALPKLTASTVAVDSFNAMGLGTAGMYIIGALEVAGAVALLIPVLSGLAGLSFVALMIGAVAFTLTMDPSMVAVPAVVLVLAAAIAWGRRNRNAQLAALVRRYTTG